MTDRNDDRMSLRVLPRRAAAVVSARLLAASAMSHQDALLRLDGYPHPTTRSSP